MTGVQTCALPICYDAFNRTEKVETFDGHIQLNRYDAEGLRYEMEENGNLVRFIFNQNREVVTEEDNSGLNRLIRVTELIAANSSADSARTYYHYASDEMGSTTHIVDEAGKVLNRYEYDAWGNITAQEEAVPNRFKFTGQQLDLITQQYYLRARFYNPVIARFTQEDTYRGDGLNLYAYCHNRPLYYFDPTGKYSDCVKSAYDRIRKENPTLSASAAYQKALQETGFDKLSKEDNRRRSEAANLNRELKNPNLTPAERERIFNKLDKINNMPSTPRPEGYGASDPPVRIEGTWSEDDISRALFGHPPRGLGSPDIHHGDQMPGASKHEIIPELHRNNSALHPNKYNQGVTPEMRMEDRNLHWWYRAREQGADQLFPNLIYDDDP